MPFGIALPEAVIKVLAEQAELPELIGDVLADVSDRAVRAHDDFAVLGFLLARCVLGRGRGLRFAALAKGRRGHHPAASILALFLEIYGPRCLRSSNALAQNLRWRISLSRGSTSYSMPRRYIVSTWRATMASATRWPIAASSPSPASMACRVSDRRAKSPGSPGNWRSRGHKGPSRDSRSESRDRR